VSKSSIKIECHNNSNFLHFSSSSFEFVDDNLLYFILSGDIIALLIEKGKETFECRCM
jgi:hypothetical protein